MTDVFIIAVGNEKEEYYRRAVDEYAKRISAFARVTVREIKEKRLLEDPSAGEIERALGEEGKDILSSLPKNCVLCALCVEGEQLSSEEFAALLGDSAQKGPVAFVIGSSHGLCKSVKEAARRRISFSKMTFPHRLMRVILFEQIYRGFSILNNGKYHK
ncbi:MAG: 23S rRNA (pseudouridine(1915)-N(3))-methyltransferase RlmH [Clostridia bacterium]|nr:23S rRNA (pseudouridine(1915)-N(3))-methyltransferase RlmH [Clostridia bacterium]